MLMTKIQKDSKTFLDGEWSSQRYASEIIKNASGGASVKYIGINDNLSAEIVRSIVASRPISKNAIRAKLAK